MYSVEDESLIETTGGTVRINVYKAYSHQIIMANCAKVISRNNFAENGIVHLVSFLKQ